MQDIIIIIAEECRYRILDDNTLCTFNILFCIRIRHTLYYYYYVGTRYICIMYLYRKVEIVFRGTPSQT